MNISEEEEYETVAQWVLEYGRGSASAIQRHFRYGYWRARYMVDRMQSEGMLDAQYELTGYFKELRLSESKA